MKAKHSLFETQANAMAISIKDRIGNRRTGSPSFINCSLIGLALCMTISAARPGIAFGQSTASQSQLMAEPDLSNPAVDSTPYSRQIQSLPMSCMNYSQEAPPAIPGTARPESMLDATLCPNFSEYVPSQFDGPAGAMGSQTTMPQTLTAQPQYGMSPLTVDFFVTQGVPANATTYQWNFGDGTVSSLPPEAFITHLYQHPGTYFCSVIIMGAQQPATDLFASVVVSPSSGWSTGRRRD